MEYFDKRKINDFNNKISSIFNLLTITGKYKVIGSSSVKSILYNSDYDLDELIKSSKNPDNYFKHLYKLFKEKFQIAKKDPSIFITDFKCGEYSGETIRWSYNDMMKGYILTPVGEKISFIDALKQKSTIKLDIIALINGSFTEFSENYFIKIGNVSNFYPDEINKKNILESIKQSYNDYISEENYLKALKRAYAYKSITGDSKYKKQLITLIEFFNSPVGILNKAVSDLNVLILLLEQKFRKVQLLDIKNNLQIIKQNLSYAFNIDLNGISAKIDHISSLNNAVSISKELIKIRDYLFNIINNLSMDFIKKNKNLLLY